VVRSNPRRNSGASTSSILPCSFAVSALAASLRACSSLRVSAGRTNLLSLELCGQARRGQGLAQQEPELDFPFHQVRHTGRDAFILPHSSGFSSRDSDPCNEPGLLVHTRQRSRSDMRNWNASVASRAILA